MESSWCDGAVKKPKSDFGLNSKFAVGKQLGPLDHLAEFIKIALHDIQIQRVDQIQLGTAHRRDVQPGFRFKRNRL